MIYSCSPKKNKSDIEVVFTQDTLNVGYTYWWEQSGPFIGTCGEELSLVFEGTITTIDSPNNEPGPLYTSQNGIIQFEKVYKIKGLGNNTYKNQGFFKADCFYNLDLAVNDKVLVFCYDYEDAYSIPGRESIVRIDDFNGPLTKSIRMYIDADQVANKIAEDTIIWGNVSHKIVQNITQIMNCQTELKDNDTTL